MRTTRTTKFDAADYLKTSEEVIAFLEDAFENGDQAEILHAYGVVARSIGMTEIAKQTGLGRESLYKALCAEGRPGFDTVLKVNRAIGVKLKPVLEPA